MAFSKFTANSYPPGAANAWQGGPVDKPNPLLNQLGEQNNLAFAVTPQPGQFPHPSQGALQAGPGGGAPVQMRPNNHFPPAPPQAIYRAPASAQSAFSPRAKQAYQSPFGKANYNSPLAQPVSSQRTLPQAPVGKPAQVKVAALSGPMSIRNLAFNGALSFLVLAVVVTGYIYFTRDQATPTAQVAGKSTTAEIVSQIAAQVVVPNQTPKLYTIDDTTAVKQQDPVFFASVAQGDYLILYETKSILYRPSQSKIVAVMDKSLN